MKTWDKSYVSGPDMVFKYDMHIKQDYEISNMILYMIIRQTYRYYSQTMLDNFMYVSERYRK